MKDNIKTDDVVQILLSVENQIVDYIHEHSGICGHCGKRNCSGRKSNSILPTKLPTNIVLAAIVKAIHPSK